jgi:hypothetical protein
MDNYILIKKYNYLLISLSAIFGQQGVNSSTTSLRIFNVEGVPEKLRYGLLGRISSDVFPKLEQGIVAITFHKVTLPILLHFTLFHHTN